MKFTRLTSLAFAAALAIPAAAHAQTELLHFEGVKNPGGDLVGSAQTGAYLASRAPFGVANRFDIYCLDMDHVAQSVWTAHYVTFQEAVGVYSVQAQRQLGTEKSWGVAQLRAAAYLTTQFSSSPQNQWDEIHGSIWTMFSNNGDAAAHNSRVVGALAIAGNDASWDQYLVALDERVFAANYNAATADLNQAFLVDDDNVTIRVVTPEPSTYVLMGAGLLAVGFVRRRRHTA